MNNGKLFAVASMGVLGLTIIGALWSQTSQAQSGNAIKPLKLASVSSVTTNNPRGLYVNRTTGAYYCDDSKICNDNSGISVWTGSFPTPYTECGSLGLKGAGGEFLYNSTNIADVRWESRTTCNGNIAIGSSDSVVAQTLTITGTTESGKQVTVNANVLPVLEAGGVGHGNWRFYLDTNGASYYCRADHAFGPLRYPNDCDLTLEQALKPEHLARAGNPAVAGDGLCQTEESFATAPSDCPDTAPPVISAISGATGYGSTTISWVTDEPSDSVVDHGSSAAYGSTNYGGASTTNHTVSLNVSMSYGVTYYYRVKSKDSAGNQATSDQQTLMVPVPPIACTDSDGGMNSSIKGVSTGIYSGGAVGYHFIFGTGTAPTTPIATTEKSTYYDHCATTTQLNEGFCDAATSRMSAIGLPCANGCSNGVCLSATTTGTTTTGTTTVTESARSCGNNETCPKDSWCSNALKCYYPDAKVTCTPWVTSTSSSPSPQTLCPSGTQDCDPANTSCVSTGQTVDYAENKWCQNGQRYYSSDGKKITCVPWSQTPPAGFSTCRPGDTSCIPQNGYGPSSGNCPSGMKCYQKEQDTNANNDAYCSAPPAATGSMEPVSCPSGYTPCSSTDKSCKTIGDKWTSAEGSSAYCMAAQKCSTSDGGGQCVGMKDVCPSGTLYCSQNVGGSSSSCVEPDTYADYSSSNQYYWCGGGGMDFHNLSLKKVYCPAKTTGNPGYGMLTAAEIKAIFQKLGSGWQLCDPPNTASSSKCLEPGQTGSSNDWCAWTPPGAGMASSSGSTKTCPALDGTSSPPPPPPPPPGPGTTTPPIADHTGCDDTMYNLLNGRYVDERGAVGPAPDASRYYKLFESGYHFHLCGTGSTGTTTWPVSPPGTSTWPERPSPEEPRECAPGEMASPGPSAMSPLYPRMSCMMPMYRWNLGEQKWEKCDYKKIPPYVNVQGNSKATHTNCTSLDLELEGEWRAEAYKIHDPRVDGEWYSPPWDASAEMYRYDPKSDGFAKCGKESFRTTMMPFPGDYSAPCTPVPEKDKDWMLKKFRAEYKMSQRWRAPKPLPPTWPPEKPLPPDQPPPIVEPPLPPLPEIPAKQCKQYLNGIRNGLNGDKQFWKDVKNQLKNAPKEYADRLRVEELLKEAKGIIIALEAHAKRGKCLSDVLSDIQQKQQQLHTEIFSELSTYLPQMQDYAELEQCMASLSEKAEGLNKFMKELKQEDDKVMLKFIARINEKLKELKENREDFEYDAVFECREFKQEVDPELINYRLSSDTELNRIVDEVVEKKFEPIITKLTEQLEQSGKKIDELIFKVAEVHKAIESVSQSASQISEKIAVSYTQLSRFSEEYEKQRVEIQTAKDRLIPLVETALQAVKEKSCVPAGDRESLVQEFGKVASVNWLSEKASELEKRLNFFITSCRSRDVSASDLTAFHNTVTYAQEENLRISYEQKITPFPDVPTHEWYYGGMVTAAKEGYLTQGRPGESVLRQDALLMVLRAAGLRDEELKGECEVGASVRDVSPYARCAVAAGQKRGLTVKGNMSEPIQRGEVARWISELNLVPQVDAPRVRAVAGEYEDIRSADQAWQNSITRLVEAKVMVGVITDTSKKWQPRDPLTRAALAVVLEQLLKAQSTVPTNP